MLYVCAYYGVQKRQLASRRSGIFSGKIVVKRCCIKKNKDKNPRACLSADVPELLVLETVQKTRRDTIYLIQCSAVWSQESETTYQIAKTIVLYVLPLWLMSVAYCQIVRVLWKSDNIPGHTETVQMFNANAYNGRCTLRIRASGGLGGVFAYPTGVAGSVEG